MGKEVEIGGMLEKAFQKLEEGQGMRDSPLEPWEGAWLCQHPDFILLASSTVKDCILVVFTTTFVVVCYNRPKK